MSQEDIDKAVREAQQFEAEDKKKKEAIDARNEADSFVFQTEKALKEVGDKVSDSDKAAVQADLDALKSALAALPQDGTAMTDEQVANIKSLKEKLMNSAQGVFTKMYEQAQAQGAQGAAGTGADAGADASSQQGGHDDNVVDGDYKEV